MFNRAKPGFYGVAIAGAVAKEMIEGNATKNISNEEAHRLLKERLNALKKEDLDELIGSTRKEVEDEFLKEFLNGELPKSFDIDFTESDAESLYADNFSIGGVHKFLAATLSKGCNPKKIESMLNKNHLSIEKNNIGFTGKKRIKFPQREKESHFHRLSIRHFDSASTGFKALCKMLFVDPQENSDILNLDSHSSYTKHDTPKATNATSSILAPPQEDFTEDMIRLGVAPTPPKQTQADKVLQLHVDELSSWPKGYRIAFLEIMKCLTGIPSLKEADIVDFNAFVESNKNNRFIKKILPAQETGQEYEEIEITDITLQKLKELYIETALHSIGTRHGCQAELAKIAGVTDARISQLLSELGFKENLNKFNFQPKKRLAFIK
jgi:hypothetical protein